MYADSVTHYVGRFHTVDAERRVRDVARLSVAASFKRPCPVDLNFHPSYYAGWNAEHGVRVAGARVCIDPVPKLPVYPPPYAKAGKVRAHESTDKYEEETNLREWAKWRWAVKTRAMQADPPAFVKELRWARALEEGEVIRL